MAFADTARLAVRLDLDDNLTRGTDRAARSVDKLGDEAAQTDRQLKGMGRTGSRVGRQLKGMGGPGGMGIGGMLGAGALGGLGFLGVAGGAGLLKGAVDTIIEATNAAAAEEAAINQLNTALVENNKGRQVNIDLVEEQIAQRQTRLGFVDAEQRESLRLLIAYTKDYDEANRLLGLSMDFARLRGIDLKTASDLLGKAAAGNTSLLSRYGVVLEKGATAQEAFAQIQEMSEGQAEAWADTLQGKATRAAQNWGDTMEDLGRAFQPITEPIYDMANDAIPLLAEAIRNDLAPELAGGAAAVGDFVDEVAGHWQRGADILDDIGDMAEGTIFDRDYVNDFANFARIVGTGGTALAYDALPAVRDAADAASQSFHDLMGWTHDSERAVDLWALTSNKAAQASAKHANEVLKQKNATSGLTSETTALNPELEETAAIELTLADAVKASTDSYRDQRKSVREAIKDARETKEGRGGVQKQLDQLTREEERLVRKQAAAAEGGKVRKVAAWQAAIEKVREEKTELQNMLALYNVIRQSGPIDVNVRTNYVLGTVQEGAVVVSSRDIAQGQATVNNTNRNIGS